MAIKTFKIITIEEFKTSEIFDSIIGENATMYKDNYIDEAIIKASSQLDRFSGSQIEFIWDSLNESTDIENQKKVNWVKIACCMQVQFLIRNGIEYARSSQETNSSGNISYSISNPSDPYFVVEEAQNLLQKAGFYNPFMSFNVLENNKSSGSNVYNPNDIDLDGEYESYTRKESDNRYFKKQGSFESTDNTIKVDYNPEGTGKFNLRSNTDIIANKIIDNDTTRKIIIERIEEILNNDNDFKEVLEKALATMLENDKAFIKSVSDILVANEQFKQDFKNAVYDFLYIQLKKQIFEELSKDQNLANNTAQNIANDSKNFGVIATAIANDTQFRNYVEKFASEYLTQWVVNSEEFIKSVVNSQEFKDEVVKLISENEFLKEVVEQAIKDSKTIKDLRNDVDAVKITTLTAYETNEIDKAVKNGEVDLDYLDKLVSHQNMIINCYNFGKEQIDKYHLKSPHWFLKVVDGTTINGNNAPIIVEFIMDQENNSFTFEAKFNQADGTTQDIKGFLKLKQFDTKKPPTFPELVVYGYNNASWETYGLKKVQVGSNLQIETYEPTTKLAIPRLGEIKAMTIMQGLATLSDRITQLEQKSEQLQKQLDSAIFVGLRVWVAIGTKMPPGWKRIDMREGYTFVNSSVEGVENGYVYWTQHIEIQGEYYQSYQTSLKDYFQIGSNYYTGTLKIPTGGNSGDWRSIRITFVPKSVISQPVYSAGLRCECYEYVGI